MKKHYTINEVPLTATKVMYEVKVTLADAMVGENIFSTEYEARAWIDHMKQLDAQGR